jgi:putative transposase
MIKCRQILLLPSKKQARNIDEQIEEHRLLYNNCLGFKKSAWDERKENVTCFDLIKKNVKKFKKISNHSSMQQTVRRLDKAFHAFFRRIKSGEKPGYPRFKNKDRFRTIEYGAYGDGNKIKDGRLYLQNVGHIKASKGDFPENIRKISITRIGDKYYASIIYDTEPSPPKSGTGKSVGIDVGISTFVATSDGELFKSPKFHKKSLKEEAKVHRRIHRAKKGSKERQKHKKSLQKIKFKTANRRKDFNHKLSRNIVDRYDIFVLEDINLTDLTSDIRNINRSYADVGIGQFRTFLTYKAENAGKIVLKVDPAYTTQECSSCGDIREKPLNERIHKCLQCGYEEDRDVNAAKNILMRGLKILQTRASVSGRSLLVSDPRSPRIYSGE